MSDDSTFDLSFDSDIDGFDPLSDADDTDELDEEGSEYIPSISSATDTAEQQNTTPTKPEKSASERTADLYAAMQPQRKVILGILSFCLEPAAVADVNARVAQLQENNYSVYTAADLCTLLERAGAIRRTNSDGGELLPEDAEPEVEIIDGVEYLKPREPQQVCWLTTDAGRELLDADKPLERLRDLFESESGKKYATIYKRVLTLCATPDGASTKSLSDAVDNDPLVKKPRLYAPHFIDRLEKCDAIEWRKIWCITEVGKQGLEMLSDIEDTGAPNTDDAKNGQENNDDTSSTTETSSVDVMAESPVNEIEGGSTANA